MWVIRIFMNGWWEGRIGAVRPRPIRSLARIFRAESGRSFVDGFGVIVNRKPLRWLFVKFLRISSKILSMFWESLAGSEGFEKPGVSV